MKGFFFHKEYTWNMKALSRTVHKLWPRLKFLRSRSNLKVKVTRSNIMVWCERSCHKQYTCEYMKSLSPTVHKLWKVCKTSRSMSPGQKLWYDVKGLVTRSTLVKYESLVSCCSYVMTKVLSTDDNDDNNNDTADYDTGAMTIVLRTFVTAN